MNKFLKKNKKKIIILSVILIALIAVAMIIYDKNKSSDSKDNDEIGKADIRTIVNSVSGTGTVKSVSTTDINSSLTGSSIKEIKVAVGDKVSPGDVVCVMDTTNEENQIKDLESQIAEAKKTQQDSQQAANDASVSAKATADATASSAASSYNDNINRLNDLDARIGTAQGELQAAKDDLATTQAKYDQAIKDGTISDDPLKEGTDGKYTKYVQYQTVLQSKNQTVTLRQANVDNLTNQRNTIAATIATQSQAAGVQAPANLFSGMGNTSTGIQNSTINLLNAQIKSLQDRIDMATIKSPVSGTVTEIDSSKGGIYLGGSIVVVEATDSLQIVSSVDEYDIPDVSVGMKAKIKTDATRDDILDGTVTFIAPKAYSTAASSGSLSSIISGSTSGMDLSNLGSTGSASYEVRLSLDTPSPRLRLGMNSKISIITKTRENVLTVPFEAVKTRNNGTKYVIFRKVVADKDGNKKVIKKNVTIVTGIEGTNYIEVLDGNIKKGDEVILAKHDTENSVEDLMNMMGSDAGI